MIMKRSLLLLGVVFMLCGVWACSETEENGGDVSVEELQQQINELKAQLEKKITKVEFEGNLMLLTFADGTTLRTATPNNVIPTIGENGNWWVNGVDLGMPAKAEAVVPTIGENGNWWVDGKDTGKPARGEQGSQGDKGEQGAQGEKGEQGEAGRGIDNITYDPEIGKLTIVLTDGTKYDFTLKAVAGGDGDVTLGGDHLSDEAPYLLSKIYNGDFPFAEFKYNDNNGMTNAIYYQNVGNEPLKTYALNQEFGANNKVSTETIVEYATKPTAVMDGWEFPDKGYVDGMDYRYVESVAFFDKLFPGMEISLAPDSYLTIEEVKGMAMKELLSQAWGHVDNEMNENEGILVQGDSVFLIYSFDEYKVEYRATVKTDKYYPNVLKVENGKKFMYTSNELYYDINEVDDEDGDVVYPGQSDGYKNADGGWCIDGMLLQVNEYGEITWMGGQRMERYCVLPSFRYKLPVVAKGEKEDEVTASYIKDYRTLTNYYNPNKLTGDYKYLAAKFNRYGVGEVMNKEVITYRYEGNNMTAVYEGEDYLIFDVTGDQIKKVWSVDADSTKKEVLALYYNADGTLKTIDVPCENIKGIAEGVYDEDGNLTELIVDATQLKGKGYADEMCALGLAYRYQDYDEEWGTVVEKVKYVKGTLLKLGYNKKLKNFMNHTVVAVNPLLAMLVKGKHAVNEIIWKGHGSCFMSEYTGYNAGGYPTGFKGLLQISLSDFEDEDFAYPVNGSVATLYRLEYVNKK